MNIHWVYFSDTNTSPGEIKKLLAEDSYELTTTYQIDRLHGLLIENKQSVLFVKANTLYNVYDLCQEISTLYPHVYIILIVPDNMENLKKAMLMGASDTLRSSYETEKLEEALFHAKRYMQHRANKENSFINLVKENSTVIAVSSPKGGAGRTLITINLAVALSKMGKKVAIIDGNLQFGEVAMYFNMKPKRTIYEWVKEGYGRPNYTITQYMTVSESDVSVLAAPPRPEFFEGILEEHIKAAIEEAKKLFDVVLIDMPVALSEIHLRCLDLAEEILLVSTNEISTLRLSQLYLETLESIKLKDKVKLVLNRYVKNQGIELRKIEDILGLEIYHSLPDQENVASSSIEAGYPFILSNARSPLGKSVLKLSEKLFEHAMTDIPEKKKEKRWFLIGK